jgi:RNA polymerase sigma factor (sigma-70 family)
MHQCINALEMVEKRLFKLRYVKGLGVKTVARMMNMSEDRVRKLSKKTMNKVTEMVKDERRKDERKNRWC